MNQAIFQEPVIRIPTPEQVFLEYPLAGFPRRTLATLLDGVIIFGGEIMLALIFVVLSLLIPQSAKEMPNAWFIAFLVAFFLFIGVGPLFYFGIFEYYWNGQTPGKRAAGIRVIRANGLSIDRTSSALRNLFRIIDLLPTSYMVGIWSMMLSRNQQRLGDLVGGTIVIALPRAHRRSSIAAGTSAFTQGSSLLFEGKRAEEERMLLDQFLRRRQEIESGARVRIARMLAERNGLMPGQALTLLEQQLYDKFKSL